MKKRIALLAIVVTWGGALVRYWRRHPRLGAGTVNRIVNPWLMRHEVADASRGEIGLLEHVGRTTGTVRVTPIHQVQTADGFRIIVPLGSESQWARNVLAAGHCRVQVGDAVHELDEPRLLNPTEVGSVPPILGRTMAWLGFRYLRLHEFAEHPGTLAMTPHAEPRAAAKAASRKSRKRGRQPIELAPSAPEPSEAIPSEPETVPVT